MYPHKMTEKCWCLQSTLAVAGVGGNWGSAAPSMWHGERFVGNLSARCALAKTAGPGGNDASVVARGRAQMLPRGSPTPEDRSPGSGDPGSIRSRGSEKSVKVRKSEGVEQDVMASCFCCMREAVGTAWYSWWPGGRETADVSHGTGNALLTAAELLSDRADARPSRSSVQFCWSRTTSIWWVAVVLALPDGCGRPAAARARPPVIAKMQSSGQLLDTCSPGDAFDATATCRPLDTWYLRFCYLPTSSSSSVAFLP